MKISRKMIVAILSILALGIVVIGCSKDNSKEIESGISKKTISIGCMPLNKDAVEALTDFMGKKDTK